MQLQAYLERSAASSNTYNAALRVPRALLRQDRGGCGIRASDDKFQPEVRAVGVLCGESADRTSVDLHEGRFLAKGCRIPPFQRPVIGHRAVASHVADDMCVYF